MIKDKGVVSQMYSILFHSQALHHIPQLFEGLHKEDSTSASKARARLAELLHCLMHHFSGFPDLYEPLLDILKVGLPSSLSF